MSTPNYRRSFEGVKLDPKLEQYLAAVERSAESERLGNEEILERILKGSAQTAAMASTLKSADQASLDAVLAAVAENPTLSKEKRGDE